MPRLKALVFDMDGTLADTDPVHLRAFERYLAPHGVTVDEEVYRAKIAGRTNAQIFEGLLPAFSAEDHKRFGQEKEALFRELAEEIEPLAGLTSLLDWAEARSLRVGLVTNGPRPNVDHTLRALGIAQRFAVTIASEDVTRGKPDPLPYLTALDRLGIGAAEAVAFEDSPSGVRAAKAAGILTIGILTGQTAEALASSGADMTVRDFADPGLLRLLAERV